MRFPGNAPRDISKYPERLLVPLANLQTTLLFALLGAALVASCGQPAEHEACAVQARTSCPTDALTFDTGIAELLHARCYPCHAADGVESSRQLTDYAHVYGERMSIAGQVASCSMPPAGSPQLTSSERQQILDWFACSAPE